jgi:hypothetical protein
MQASPNVPFPKKKNVITNTSQNALQLRDWTVQYGLRVDSLMQANIQL